MKIFSAILKGIGAIVLFQATASPQSIVSPAPAANGTFLSQAISSDGLTVAFCSDSTNLIAGATYGFPEIYAYNLSTGVLERDSVSASGVPADFDCNDPSISANGRYVAFDSSADNLAPGITIQTGNIFVYDRTLQTTEQVSLRNDGTQPIYQSTNPSISGDGTYVVFESQDANLAGNPEANTEQYVYIVDTTQPGTVAGVTQVPLPSTPSSATAMFFQNPVISGDGNSVAFEFRVAGPQYNYQDIYVYNRTTMVNTRITGATATDGTSSNGWISEHPSISANGQYVAFDSNLLLTGDGSLGSQSAVYVANLAGSPATFVMASTNSAGTPADQASQYAAISGDGNSVAFQSGADNLYPGVTGAISPFIFEKNLTTNAIAVPEGAQANNISQLAAISSDGTIVSFLSQASNLVAGANVSLFNVFVATVSYTPPVSNATLQALTTTAGALTPAFASGTASYTVTVPYATESITVTPTTTDSAATVTVDSIAVTSGSASAAIPLSVGPNPINIVVTGSDGTTTMTYTITVTQVGPLSSRDTLASLAISAGTLSPTFASATTNYVATVPAGTTSVTVTPTVADSIATVNVNNASVVSGSASAAIALPTSGLPVQIRVDVTAQDNTGQFTMTYLVQVATAAPPTATPTGAFGFTSPDPSTSTATQMVDMTGNYQWINGGLITGQGNTVTLDVAMDELGKLVGMGTMEGFDLSTATQAAAGTGSNRPAAVRSVRAASSIPNALPPFTGSVKTVNNTPTLSTGMTVTRGTLDGAAVSGTQHDTVPLAPNPVQGGDAFSGVIQSGSEKVNGKVFKQKPQLKTLNAQADNAANLHPGWSLALSLSQKTSAKGKPYIEASAILNLPDGETTEFALQKVTYSTKHGYSILFETGVKLDAAGSPILNVHGKPIHDTHSKISISKMNLALNGGVWQPISGGITYHFLGQAGKGNLLDFQ